MLRADPHNVPAGTCTQMLQSANGALYSSTSYTSSYCLLSTSTVSVSREIVSCIRTLTWLHACGAARRPRAGRDRHLQQAAQGVDSTTDHKPQRAGKARVSRPLARAAAGAFPGGCGRRTEQHRVLTPWRSQSSRVVPIPPSPPHLDEY
eukprot:COSAG01_NODE_9100_length_2555_cov_4.367264_2_plen_149_part_00